MTEQITELDKLYEKISKNRDSLEEVALDLKTKIKTLENHSFVGQVLARYIDVLAKLNDQLIELQKFRNKKEIVDIKKDNKQSTKDTEELANSLGTSIDEKLPVN